jgi:hypothetical protein
MTKLRNVKSKASTPENICKITDEALSFLEHYSDGFPGVVQELGYQAFEANKDESIDQHDVIDGIIGERCIGALQSLYVKHFEPIYPGKLRSRKSLAVLKAFVDSPNDEISHQMLTQALQGLVAPTSIGGY